LLQSSEFLSEHFDGDTHSSISRGKRILNTISTTKSFLGHRSSFV
jgi:hypothetical protein